MSSRGGGAAAALLPTTSRSASASCVSEAAAAAADGVLLPPLLDRNGDGDSDRFGGLEAEYLHGLLCSSQRSRGHGLYSTVICTRSPRVTRSSEYAARDRNPALRLASSQRSPHTLALASS